MSQSLKNPTGTTHRDYGATASTSSTATPEVTFASGFSPTEFMTLSEDIAHNMNTIDSSSKQLEKMLQLIGTPKDSSALREKVHNINTKTKTTVDAISLDLHRLTAVVQRGDREQKKQLEKMTEKFRTRMEKFVTLQREISIAMRQSYEQSAFRELDEEPAANTELLQQQRLENANFQQERDMLLERERQVRVIETDVLDVNQIMSSLSRMVNEQGQQIETIGSTVGQATGYIEDGRTELQKAMTYRQSYRRKILILLVIAVIIGLIVTGIIVSKLKS